MADKNPIHLPVFQRFDCHSCTYCCRAPLVTVNATERRKIIDAGWANKITDQPLFVAHRIGGRRRYCLAKQADGRCVFLGDDNFCRLHAESGYEAKPLACRMFPFAPTPGLADVRLDMRPGCPSVVGNQGRPLSAHAADLKKLIAEANIHPMPAPPSWGGGYRPLTADEFRCLLRAFVKIMDESSQPYRRRMFNCCLLLDLLYAINIEKIRDARFEELFDLLLIDVLDDDHMEDIPAPPRRAAKLFGQWFFLHALSDEAEALNCGLFSRLILSQKRYWQARRFARGTGRIPALVADWPTDMTFEQLASIEPADDAHLEPLHRMMRLKLEAQAVAGPGYFHYPLLTGLTAWSLMPALVGGFARISAVRSRHQQLQAQDIVDGVRRMGHAFGVSPLFRRVSERLRLRALAQPGTPAALLQAYGP